MSDAKEITANEFEAAFADLHKPIKIMLGIAQEITGFSGISLDEMRGESRKRPVVRARHLLMFKASQAGISYPAIGQYLNRDHTSVWHGVQKVKTAMRNVK